MLTLTPTFLLGVALVGMGAWWLSRGDGLPGVADLLCAAMLGMGEEYPGPWVSDVLTVVVTALVVWWALAFLRDRRNLPW